MTPNLFKLNPNEDIYLNVVVTVPKDVSLLIGVS